MSLSLSFAAVFLLFLPAGWMRTMDTFELRMPSIVPTQVDAYLCHSFTIPDDETWYITSIGPILTAPAAVHHVALGAYPVFADDYDVWNCGGMNDQAFPTGANCSDMEYDWTKDVREYHLPTGVGFKVGGQRDYQVLVVQVHYIDVSPFNQSFRDRTGVKMTFTRERYAAQGTTLPVLSSNPPPARSTCSRTPRLAALQLLGAYGVIPPGHLVNIESQCVVHLPEDTTLRIVSYLVHTHDLGLVVTDYRVRDGVWTEIGQRSPQLPKVLVPADVTLQDGDVVVLRCLFYNDRDHAVATGDTHHDEMCFTRLLFYEENGDFLPSFECDELDPSDYATRTSR